MEAEYYEWMKIQVGPRVPHGTCINSLAFPNGLDDSSVSTIHNRQATSIIPLYGTAKDIRYG